MPSEKINMHGKMYDLLDDKIRVKEVAQKKAQEIRDGGQVAFLNPQKRKDKETNYWIYVADKTVRRSSSRKSISSAKLLVEYDKGAKDFADFIETIRKVVKSQEANKELAINEPAKKTPKKVSSKAKNGKKALSKAKNGKKAPSKAKNGKKAPSKAKNGKKAPSKAKKGKK